MEEVLFIHLELGESSAKNRGPAECAVKAAQDSIVEEAGSDEQPAQTRKIRLVMWN